MRIADKAIEAGEVQGIKRWDLVGVNAAIKVAELATASITDIYYVKVVRYFTG